MQLNEPLYAIREAEWVGNMRGRTFPHAFRSGTYRASVPETASTPHDYVLVDAVKSVRARGVRFEPGEGGTRHVVFEPERRDH